MTAGLRCRPALATSLVAGALLAAGCGSSSSTPSAATPSASPSPVVVTTTGGEQTVTVHLGDRIHLVLPAGAQVSENGVSHVAPEGNGVYKAVGVGTASIEVVAQPSCQAGQECSHLLRLLSVVEVTVKNKR